MKVFLLSLLFFLSFLFGDTLDELSKDSYWRLLLHIPNGTNKSEIDSVNFFLSKNGKENPKEEIEATVYSLQNETSLEDDNTTQCRFPARAKWIREKLNLDFKIRECKQFDELYKKIDPKSVTLVFSNAHINSPASMFGHTFLRIDSSLESKLLSYAINYAAMANQSTENGFIFAIKGLFGGYYGKYSLLPYYEKLKEYTDTEQRDIWEYELNLSEKEIQRMFMHIWELKDTYSNYFFFDENCSYNILWLLEIARPSALLREQFFYQVSPPETLFAVKNQSMIQKILYRPSKRTKLLAYEKILNDDEMALVYDLAYRKDSTFQLEKIEPQHQRYILESALEFCEYLYIENKISKDIYLERSHNLSILRSKLGRGVSLEIDLPKNPLEGHRQFRMNIAKRIDENSTKEMYFGIRPTYHNSYDSDSGFLLGTQIEFFDYLFKLTDSKYTTESLTLLSLASLTPQSNLFQPFSWRTSFGFDRKYLNDKLLFKACIGGGKSWSIFNDRSYFYLLADGGSYEKFSVGQFGALNIGISINHNEKFKTNIEARKTFYTDGEKQKRLQINSNYFFSKSTTFAIDYEKIDKFKGIEEQVKVIINFYF